MARSAQRQMLVRSLLWACLAAVVGGCTSSAAGPRATSPASTPAKPPSPEAAAVCTNAQIRSAVARFFASWNHHEEPVVGGLFGTQGILDMATKHQDTLRSSEYTEAVGTSQVDAFAAQQWALGETFSYNGMDVYPPQYGGGGGAEVNGVDARFADGSVQQIEEAKFNYSCSGAVFTHVVIISLGVARKP